MCLGSVKVGAGGHVEFLTAWASLWVAVLVGGLTLFVSGVVTLNLAIRAGFNRAWIVVPVAMGGSLAATVVSALAGSAPNGLDIGSGSYLVAAFWADWAMAFAVGYLVQQKIRMGERLKASLIVPADHLSVSVPTMMLVTLIENAIKHGISPSPEGGSVRISSTREGDSLCISVIDTGRGFIAESGDGIGLSNIRARLAALHGDKAALWLSGNQPRGVQAMIVLPWTEGLDSR